MKSIKLTAILICLFLTSGFFETVQAQDGFSWREQLELKAQKSRIDSNYSFRGSSINQPCYDQTGQWTAKDISINQNWNRCRYENRFCKKLRSDNYKNSLTGAYQQCVIEFWGLVKREDFSGAYEVRQRRNNGAFDRYNSAEGVSTKPPPQLQSGVKPANLTSARTIRSHDDYGTDIDDLDASDIEILDVVEGEAKPSNDITKSCLCYAGDFENLGICHSSDHNSPNYNKRNAWGELISTYPTGEYPWTAACKHPVGGQVNLREWHKNYNDIRR